MHFPEKYICSICRHSSQHKTILFSEYYAARGGTTMNYAEKSRHFYCHAYYFFQKEYLIR